MADGSGSGSAGAGSQQGHGHGPAHWRTRSARCLSEANRRCDSFVGCCRAKPLPAPLAGLALCAALAFSAWGFVNGTADPNLVRVEVALPRLPAQLDGFALALMTDIHAGQTVGLTRVSAAVDIVNSLNADVVLIAGDLIDAPETFAGPMVTPLARLRSARNATYFATGNHDYYEGSLSAKFALLGAMGIRVLTNEIVALPPNAPPGSPTFDLLGVPDWAESKKAGPWNATDLPGAVAGRDPTRELVVMAHQPAHAPQSGDAGAGIQLSGHVHCGQLLPVHLGAAIGNLYFRGLYTRRVDPGRGQAVKDAIAAAGAYNPGGSDAWHTQVYMSCGTYGWGPLMRMAAPHEVTLVVLRSASVVGADFQGSVQYVRCTGVGCKF